MSGAAAVIAPNRIAVFSGSCFDHIPLFIVLLLVGSCSNRNCSSLLSRPSLLSSLVLCQDAASCVLLAHCASVSVCFSLFFLIFYNDCCCVWLLDAG